MAPLLSQETGKDPQGTDDLPGEGGWEKVGSPLDTPGKGPWEDLSSASKLPHPKLHSWALEL